VIYSGNRLPVIDRGNWRTVNNLFDLQREAYSRYRDNSGKPISAISWLAYCYQLFAAGAPLNWISYTFWLKPLKPFFAIKRVTSPLNLKRDYQRFNVKV
jgi:hypothetical protein